MYKNIIKAIIDCSNLIKFIFFSIIILEGVISLIYINKIKIYYENIKNSFINNYSFDNYIINYIIILIIMYIVILLLNYLVAIFLNHVYKKIYFGTFKKILFEKKDETKEKYSELNSSIHNFITAIRYSTIALLPSIIEISIGLFLISTLPFKEIIYMLSYFSLCIILSILIKYIYVYYFPDLTKYDKKYSILTLEILENKKFLFIYKINNYYIETLDDITTKMSKTKTNSMLLLYSLINIINITSVLSTIFFFIYFKGNSKEHCIASWILVNGISKDIFRLLRTYNYLSDLSTNSYEDYIYKENNDNKVKEELKYTNLDSKNATRIKINFKEGEVIMKRGNNKLTGNNGSGKTTLLYEISKIYKNNLLLFQHDIVMESKTIEENIIGSIKYDKKLLEYILKSTNSNLYFDYQQLCKKNIKNLCGGERKIINILRFLYYFYYNENNNVNNEEKYDIIMLDEPFNHLDNKKIKWAKEVIDNLPMNKIVIIIDHSNVDCNYDNIIDLNDVEKYPGKLF